MRYFLFLSFFSLFSVISIGQTIQDDFEGNGTIALWFADDCDMDISFSNSYKTGMNTSNTVLKYADTGKQYANVRFDVDGNYDLSENSTFTVKIYIPSSGITGNQRNQISLKLQDGSVGSPWSTQSEIVKSLNLDTWQTIQFNFSTDTYINLNGNSQAPITRTDFNRVVLQINGEDNIDEVIAYIDDFLYDGTVVAEEEEGGGGGSSNNTVYDNLVWSDEFNGSGAIDSDKWHHQTQLPAGGGWYNGEIQHYTNREDNSYASNGSLHLVAKKEPFTDQGHTKQYTSARLNSKIAFTYGRVSVRAKLPTGVGTWPAIWTLGKNINESGGYWSSTYGTTNWPACGEIDIMEHWGNNQNYISSAMHTPSSFGGTVNYGGQNISTASTTFHIYELIWTKDEMIFSVDGVVHYTYNPSTKNSATWPFDAEQYILLNFAIQPEIAASFTQDAMEIDYVRIYQESTLSSSSLVKKMDEVRLFPNPVIDFMKIKVPAELIGAKATIYSVLGQKMDSFVQEGVLIQRDLSSYSKGLYIIRFESDFGTAQYSILKK
jgi:beta-glucanase (GH16 family)